MIFQIDFPKKCFSIFFDFEKKSRSKKIEKKNLRKVNLKNENFKISKNFREKCAKKSSEKSFEKIFLQDKKICFIQIFFVIWNISLLLKNHTYISRFDFIRVPRIQTSNSSTPQDSISITMFIYEGGCLRYYMRGGGRLRGNEFALCVCIGDRCKRLEIQVLVEISMLKKIRIKKIYFSWRNLGFCKKNNVQKWNFPKNNANSNVFLVRF